MDETALKLAGLVRGRGDGVRVLAKGALNTPLTINVTGASKAAVAAVESAGGTITMRRIKEASVEPKKTKNNVAKRKSRSGEKKAKPAAVEENPNSDSGGKSDLGPVDG